MLGTYVLGSTIKSLFKTINSTITYATTKAFVESLQGLGGGGVMAVAGIIIGLPIDMILWCVRKRYVLPQRRELRKKDV